MEFHFLVTVAVPDGRVGRRIYRGQLSDDENVAEVTAGLAESLRACDIPDRVVKEASVSVEPCPVALPPVRSAPDKTLCYLVRVEPEDGPEFSRRFTDGLFRVELCGASELVRLNSAPVCPACHHAPHEGKVCGLRAAPHLPACLCTAMDCTCFSDPLGRCVVHPKSARRWLTGPGAFWRNRPPYIVVWAWGALGWLLFAGMLLKPHAT